MPYLVDGDNLLGTWPGRSRSDADKRRLSAELARMARRENRQVGVGYTLDGGQTWTVVFDGMYRKAAEEE